MRFKHIKVQAHFHPSWMSRSDRYQPRHGDDTINILSVSHMRVLKNTITSLMQQPKNLKNCGIRSPVVQAIEEAPPPAVCEGDESDLARPTTHIDVLNT